MDNPKIRIESNGICTEVYLDGKKIRCTQLDFHGDLEGGLHFNWKGVMQKLDENGRPYVENDEIVTEKFHYDSNEAVVD